MFILARAVTYATFFVGFFMVFLPSRVLGAAGAAPPGAIGAWQGTGMAIGATGAVLAAACILAFVFIGRGTQAPFDPPRRLVVAGPYRLLRNPMYLGAAVAMLGAAMFYQSTALALYVLSFLAASHLFVVGVEEPALRRSFGREYEAYCARVRRWWLA